MADMATPASSQAAVKKARLGACATASTAMAPRREPVVITTRGPRRSRMRPMGIPASAETMRAAEKAPVVPVVDQPVSAVMRALRTGKA